MGIIHANMLKGDHHPMRKARNLNHCIRFKETFCTVKRNLFGSQNPKVMTKSEKNATFTFLVSRIELGRSWNLNVLMDKATWSANRLPGWTGCSAATFPKLPMIPGSTSLLLTQKCAPIKAAFDYAD